MIFCGVLKSIENSGGVNLLRVDVFGVEVRVLVLELAFDIKKEDKIKMYIKPTKLFLSKEKCKFDNVFEVEVDKIKKEKVLAIVDGKFRDIEFEAVMLKEMVDFENRAYLFFRANDISVLGFCDD